jgi:ATP-dependent Lhr-like helicase
MGWRELRPLQEESIAPILDGHHGLLLAPTAGGKTEAAVFPLLSRMLSENWGGLSVLYVCPIKALLNNLEVRLSRYCELVGRRCALWHGDISATVKGRILTNPPDVLLTTPESLEVMLMSRRADKRVLFGDVQAMVVDEIHAFAGDDRGWHLLSVLERIGRFAGREIQRIGLSATIGNPEGLLDWLAGACEGERAVIAPEGSGVASPELALDFVGNLKNAALVISRLHRGEKRLVFCDSRARVEELAAELRKLEVETYVSHSSVSIDDRRRAEEAFTVGSDCVIVATSTLELGIDVGDLDRVIQIDAPLTVASLLQRMGRTGRRAGTRRNCLMLATTRDALVRGAALLDLLTAGYVEPIEPPAVPYHVLAQQVMALALQQSGIGIQSWHEWVGRMPAFAAMDLRVVNEILHHMIQSGVLFDDHGTLWFDQEGERTYGRRYYLELFSVFYSPPLFKVRYGQKDLGEVHELTFLTRSSGTPVLLLGGRSWAVVEIEWRRRVAYVEPVEDDGRSRWLGTGQPLSFTLCRFIRRILASDGERDHWSRRASNELADARQEARWITEDGAVAVVEPTTSKTTWWTFAGLRANGMLAERIEGWLGREVRFDNLKLTLGTVLTAATFDGLLGELRRDPPMLGASYGIDDAVKGLKFSDCLPFDVARDELRRRTADRESMSKVVAEQTRFVTAIDPASPR